MEVNEAAKTVETTSSVAIFPTEVAAAAIGVVNVLAEGKAKLENRTLLLACVTLGTLSEFTVATLALLENDLERLLSEDMKDDTAAFELNGRIALVASVLKALRVPFLSFWCPCNLVLFKP